MAAAVEGAQVDFDNASEIEGRYFVDLVTGQVAKNMIQAFFFDLQRATGDRGRPPEIEPFAPSKVVVLGAGMMGAGIAYVCAKAGLEVVLKDVSQEVADNGKGYSEKLVAKAVERGRSSQADGDALLARITPTTDPAAADGAQLVIEAVFEDPQVKAQVLAEIEPTWPPMRCWAPTRRRCRSPNWPRAYAGRPTSSACTSSARWTRCRCWRSSAARGPPTRRCTARSTWPS